MGNQRRAARSRPRERQARSAATRHDGLLGVGRELKRRLDALEQRVDEVQLEARGRAAQLLRRLQKFVAPPPRRTGTRAPQAPRVRPKTSADRPNDS